MGLPAYDLRHGLVRLGATPHPIQAQGGADEAHPLLVHAFELGESLLDVSRQQLNASSRPGGRARLGRDLLRSSNGRPCQFWLPGAGSIPGQVRPKLDVERVQLNCALATLDGFGGPSRRGELEPLCVE